MNTTSSTTAASDNSNFAIPAGNTESFIERRTQTDGVGRERRQFGSSHSGLSEAGQELAKAIDQYKVEHHRRYITCDEMLFVLTNLGYKKQ